ncbi:MAG: magnesium and cobalt transport protein CorA [Firmicutes bacterium]|nr:magnesium and cobalt transport protein CorA [Bacillota bacterium]
MNVFLKKNQPPGAAIYTGIHNVQTEISHIIYNDGMLETITDLTLMKDCVNWFIVKGLQDTAKIKSFCEQYNVDALVVEDILNVNQRNKLEFFDEYIFCVLSYAYLHENEIRHDYLSLLVFEDKVLTFHEHNVNLFDEMYKRLENHLGSIRKMKHDYLFYAILDTVIDNDIFVQKELSNRTFTLEEDIINLESTNQSDLYNSRKELLFLKSNIDPIYESFVKAEFKNTKLLSAQIYKYFDDLTDHLRRINDQITTERELLRNLLDVHINNVSNKMNAIMKTLTIFSAIFIPLSFLAGFFGMNFVDFPGLNSPNGIYVFAGSCLVIAVGMILFFKKRKWF